METSKLKKFAQFARRTLSEQVTAKLELALLPDSPARRESSDAVKKLEAAIKQGGQQQLVPDPVCHDRLRCGIRIPQPGILRYFLQDHQQ